MNDFHFIRPEWFLALLPLAAIWFAKRKLHQQSEWQQWLPSHLSAALFSDKTHKKQNNHIPWLAFVWVMTILSLAGPTWQKIEKPVFKAQLAHVIVMDMSLSMRSTDIKPDRLTKAKFKAIDLATALGDGEIGLVVYAGDAYSISPLTQDARNIAALIPSLSPEIMPIPGSYPLLGLELAQELLSQAGYLTGNIYWITDGVDSEDLDALNTFTGKSPYTINVLAVGTASGAPIKLTDGSLLKDNSGNIVMPKLNARRLQNISNLSNGLFVMATANDDDIKAFAKEAKRLPKASQRDSNEKSAQNNSLITGDDWHEAGPYLLIFIMPFCLYVFRRGVTLAIPLFIVSFILSLTPTPVFAEEVFAEEMLAKNEIKNSDSTASFTESVINKTFKTKDQRALEAFNKGKYAQAKDEFENSSWKASAAYKAGDYETALDLFQLDESASGYYNQGNTLAQMFDLEGAIKAYDKALKLNPELKDAKANKDLLEKLKEENDSQQQNKNNSQQENSQEGSQQNSNENQQSENNEQSSEQNREQGSEQNNEQSDQKNAEQSKSDQQNQPSNKEAESESDEKGEKTSEQQAKGTSEEKAQNENANKGEQQQQTAETLTAEQIAEQEQQQKIEQLLRKVDDDPSVLLRNKMILESRRRQQERRRAKGVTKSW